MCVCVSMDRTPGAAVWPSGKALGLVSTEGLRFESASAILSLQKLWSVDTVLLVTLSLTINETLNGSRGCPS